MKIRVFKKKGKYVKKHIPEAEDMLIIMVVILIILVAVSQIFLWSV